MLEVHVPHTTHTWKDFFIHIATISVGLLIAIGLEQSVEAIHRHNELHRLQQDLHGEAVANQSVGEMNLAIIDKGMAWLLELRSRTDALRTGADKKSFVYPSRPLNYPGVPHGRDRYRPLNAVWTTARETALVDLLPRNEAQLYSGFYGNVDAYVTDFEALTSDWDKLTAFEFQFSGANLPPHPNVQRMSAAQLDQYAALIDEVFMNAQTVKRRLQIEMAYNETIIDLRTPPDISQYLESHPDPLPAYKP